MTLMNEKDIPTKYFIRINKDKDILSSVEQIFGSVQTVQLEDHNEEIGFITDEATEGELKNKIEQLTKDSIISVVRIAI